jgi:phosphoribosyl-AMP cyclohydrolase / phosphoribosyl-ATP pyrophosphohydrolase
MSANGAGAADAGANDAGANRVGANDLGTNDAGLDEAAGASRFDRTIRGDAELDALRFDRDGLIPVVTQDAASGAVLMVAWATRGALVETLASGTMHYWSRSRAELWKKGATSGNVQTVVSLHADCDGDTVLARVHPAGPACHTGDVTCFGAGADAASGTGSREGSDATTGTATPAAPPRDIVRELWNVLEARDRERPEGSYTTRLLTDANLRHKKLGEELVELVTALLTNDPKASEEAADLLYHVLVALKGAGRSWDEVAAELARRRG